MCGFKGKYVDNMLRSINITEQHTAKKNNVLKNVLQFQLQLQYHNNVWFWDYQTHTNSLNDHAQL